MKDEDKTGSNLYSVYMDVYIVNIEIDFVALKENLLKLNSFYTFFGARICAFLERLQ